MSYEGESLGGTGGATPLQELLEDPDASSPTAELARCEEVRLLRDAIARLPEKERTVMALYYYEEMNQRQIGEVMHVTESRVSQIRTQALKRVRSRLAPAGGAP
jgi:RNA polymerase sigma factor for flagellar operon FliA